MAVLLPDTDLVSDDGHSTPELASYCAGFCGRNTIDNPGTWMTIDDGGNTLVWCESCWREREPDERDDPKPWVQPQW